MPKQQLSIVIPGLFEGIKQWPENDSEKDLSPSLCWLMTKASKIRHPQTGVEQTLLHIFSSTLPAEEELPVALLRSGSSEKAVICADLVSIELGVTDINIVHGKGLELSTNEIKQLNHFLNEYFQQEGMQLLINADGYGTLTLESAPEIFTTPLSSVAGQIYSEKLPQGRQQQRWHRLGNEIQMLLHDCEFNTERLTKGKLPVNALWFWGAGTNPPDFDTHYDTMYANDAFSRLLAENSKTQISPVPPGIQDLMQQNVGSKLLVVLDQLWPLGQSNDYSGWTRQLQSYEEQWFRPLLQKNLSSRFSSINLRATTGDSFVYKPHHRLRFWKRQRTLRQCQHK